MGRHLNPYLSFDGDARAAMEFYRDVLGGELTTTPYGEYADPQAPGAERLMHAQLVTDDGIWLMAADTPPGAGAPSAGSITVSLSGDDPRLREQWEQLAEGGQVTLPFEQQMWGDTFGMCTDRFGTPWMVNLVGGS
ncbi:MAG: 3-demethylubiquinone-9 3-methyltransferase [Marmoricola sp.]|nr:3-demethylubiquinone-9 3-methyltransferase [Marmoricola sp.]